MVLLLLVNTNTCNTHVILLKYTQWEFPWDESTKMGLKRIICFHISDLTFENEKERGKELVEQVNWTSVSRLFFSSLGT